MHSTETSKMLLPWSVNKQDTFFTPYFAWVLELFAPEHGWQGHVCDTTWGFIEWKEKSVFFKK